MAAPTSGWVASGLGCTPSSSSARCPAGWPLGTVVSGVSSNTDASLCGVKHTHTHTHSCPILFRSSSHEGAGRTCQLVTTLIAGDPLAGSPLSLWQRAEILRKGVRNVVGLIIRKHGVRVCPRCLLAGQPPSPSEPCPHLPTLVMTAAR